MGFASCIEDITEKFNQSFHEFERVLEGVESGEAQDLTQLRVDLSLLKVEIAGALKVFEEIVLDLMSDPTFDMFSALQDALFEKQKAEADKCYAIAQAEMRVKNISAQYWNRLQELRSEMQARIASKEHELQILQQEKDDQFRRLKSVCRNLEEEVNGLRLENSNLMKWLDEETSPK